MYSFDELHAHISKRLIGSVSVCLGLVLTSLTAQAVDKSERLIYGGGGTSSSGNQSAFSVGFLIFPNTNDVFWGLDISGEGVKKDSTWGQNNANSRASSYNVLVGKNLMRSETSRIDGALLIGMKEESTSCPRSYLGYQCYADTEPDSTYGFNSGLALLWSNAKLMIGARVTGQSTQALLGFKF